jgi:hypothetical protein
MLQPSTSTRLVLAIRMHRTSEQPKKKCAPFIRYSLAHGVVQPLLQRGEEEQEQEGAKDHFGGQVGRLDWPHHGQRL